MPPKASITPGKAKAFVDRTDFPDDTLVDSIHLFCTRDDHLGLLKFMKCIDFCKVMWNAQPTVFECRHAEITLKGKVLVTDAEHALSASGFGLSMQNGNKQTSDVLYYIMGRY